MGRGSARWECAKLGHLLVVVSASRSNSVVCFVGRGGKVLHTSLDCRFHIREMCLYFGLHHESWCSGVLSWREGIGRRLVRFRCAYWVLRCKQSARQDLHERQVHACIHTDRHRLDTYIHAPIHCGKASAFTCHCGSLYTLTHASLHAFLLRLCYGLIGAVRL